MRWIDGETEFPKALRLCQQWQTHLMHRSVFCRCLLFEMNAQHMGRIEGAIERWTKGRLEAQHEDRIE